MVVCGGDCDGDGRVSINELIITVNIALELRDASDCAAADLNGDGRITINELITGVGVALGGCPP